MLMNYPNTKKTRAVERTTGAIAGGIVGGAIAIGISIFVPKKKALIISTGAALGSASIGYMSNIFSSKHKTKIEKRIDEIANEQINALLQKSIVSTFPSYMYNDAINAIKYHVQITKDTILGSSFGGFKFNEKVFLEEIEELIAYNIDETPLTRYDELLNLLGLCRSEVSSIGDIEKAYKAKMMKAHPDKNNGDTVEYYALRKIYNEIIEQPEYKDLELEAYK